jgi:hypothetical protein
MAHLDRKKIFQGGLPDVSLINIQSNPEGL